MKKTFTLTENHIKLLSNSYVGWDNRYLGVATIDSKRPYGNSSVIEDIYELLEGKIVDEDEMEDQGISYDDFYESIYAKYSQLHKETEIALQIVLHTQSFLVGEYVLEGYGKNWVKTK